MFQVNKYAPKQYVDLIGNEEINREVIGWVKKWDFCVFGKHVKRQGYAGRRQRKTEEGQDKLLRPEKRILLLSGRAGLGKTTLASIVARHAGYNIIEVVS